MSPDWGDSLTLAIYTMALIYLIRRPNPSRLCEACAASAEAVKPLEGRGEDVLMGVLLAGSMVMSILGMAAIAAMTFGRPW